MSLKLAAEHLKAQGRGEDTHLVHMTSGELGAMQQLAKAHGGSLTINPKTGLPEAGFLSSVLPMVAGAAMVALAPETGGLSLLADPMIAGGVVGLADYAITGSITKGLMAGLGAWGGAGLASGIAGLGSAAADAANPEIVAQQLGVQGAATGPGSQAAMLAEQNAGLGADALNATRQAAATAIPAGAQTAAQAAAAGAPAGTAIQQAPISNQFLSGLQSGNVMNYMGSHLGQVASAALPAVMSSGNLFGNNAVNVPAATQQKNPFGLKSLSPDFKGQFPTPPNPPYAPQYPNYVAAPYNPAMAADGGLMADKMFASGGMYPGSQIDKTQYASSPQMPASMQTTMAGYDPLTNPLTGEPTAHMASGGIARYAGTPDYGSMVGDIGEINRGIEIATKRPVLETPHADVGINYDEPELTRLDPVSRTRKILENLSASSNVKLAKGLPKAQVLGAINTDPMMMQQQAVENASKQAIAQEAKGGLMDAYAKGGESHLGDFSDGGRLLKGPGDGVSDSIPATIAGKQPARLATGEFVVPARIVSELGNGSTDAGAKRLYDMMDRIKAKRRKTKDIAADTKAYKYLPA